MGRSRRTVGFYVAVVSACASIVSFGHPAAAQFGLGNLLGTAKNLAVDQAISQFGKSLGAQLPIVVEDGDAYPTIPNLPGGSFHPAAPPANLVAQLRASTDGTIALAPGDYAIGVDVFCMRVRAHSPAAHRYVVAELRGAAADIVRTLNARAPALRVAHFPLQILSWDIQAGLPYDAMQPAQRAIVDRVIPEYRARLAGDALENIRAKYTSISSTVPGMPGFDAALGRLGPVGESVLAMESARAQLARPPASFAELASALVPIGAVERDVSGPTPWSRYSDRVYVRFVTTGGYADPGTYQVRVLPASVAVASTTFVPFRRVAAGSPARVPMTNVVNNPGTSSVQPLTQGPSVGGPSTGPQATPSATPTPGANIASETVATSPADRTRTTIGVAEQVNLTFSGATATWSLAGGFGKLSGTAGKTNVLIAGDVAGSGTITAVDPSTHAKATIAFTVIPPSGIYNEAVPGSMIHDRNWPNSGFNMHVYLTPDSVSFENLEYREHDALAVATGVYAFENHASHTPKNGFVTVGAVVPGKGSEITELDSAYSGYGRVLPPFEPGHVSWNIPLFYRAQGHTKEYHFADVLQDSTLANDRVTLKTIKGNASASTVVSAPTVDR